MEKAVHTLPWPEAMPLPTDTKRLETAIATLSGRCPALAGSAAVLAPETLPLFFTGSPAADQGFSEYTAHYRCESLDSLGRAADGIFGSGSMFESLRTSWRRYHRGDAGTVASPREAMRGIRADVVAMNKTMSRGVARDASVSFPLTQLQLLYGQEVPPIWESEALAQDWLYSGTYRELFGKEAPDPGIDAVVARLRELYGADLSNETLDARFDVFIGTLHISLANNLANELFNYGEMLGSRLKRAQAFAAEHSEVMLGVDLAAKHRAMQALSKVLRDDFVALGKGSPQKDTVGALRSRLHIAAVNTDECMFFFHNIYAHFGFTMPPVLAEWMNDSVPEEPPVPMRRAPAPLHVAAVAVQAVAEPVIEAVEPEPVDPEFAALVADIERQRASLCERAAPLDCWTLTRSARKKLGFDIAKQLEAGYRHVDHHLFERIEMAPETTYAQSMADAAARLITLAGEYTADEVRRRVAADIALRGSIAVEGAKLQAYAQEQGYDALVRLPDIPDIAADLQRIADNWHGFSRLIRQLFPERGAELCGRIWQGLPQPNEDSVYWTHNPYLL